MALPLLLAGPIIRRVDARGATFWLAFSQPATVTATVWAGDQVSSGPATVQSGLPAVAASDATAAARFAEHLYLVTVTTKAIGGGALQPSALHSYDITVEGVGGLKAMGLLTSSSGAVDNIDAVAPPRLPLGYLTDHLPTFVGPAATITDLRFAHTSCRKPHGSGPDALAWLDDEISDARVQPLNRPQLLFLTGDQIYADDVAACLLPMVTTIGAELLGFDETIPIRSSQQEAPVQERAAVKDLPPMRRARTVIESAKLSTTDGSSHLLGFGEFAAMYLAAWSPRVWRRLATHDDLFQTASDSARENLVLTDHEAYWREHGPAADDTAAVQNWSEHDLAAFTKLKGGTDGDRQAVLEFAAAVPRVARLLANVPTMMIFDDHEVTDDWYLSAPWRTRVLVTPMGRTIIRNGLMAATLFQAIGNDPQQWHEPSIAPADWNAGTAYHLGDLVHHGGESYFAPTDIAAGGTAPGEAGSHWRLIGGPSLLSAIQTLLGDGASPTTPHLDALDQLLGLTSPTATPKVAFHYSLDGPRHRFVVLDTRTHRTYGSQTRNAPPKLLGSDMLEMLPKGPLTDGRELLVLISPAPLMIPRLFDTLAQPLMASVFDIKAHISGTERYDPGDPEPPTLLGSEDADLEGWGANQPAFIEFVRHLGSYTRVIALGGDVHFASSMAVDVWTNAGGGTAASRILQCTSSAAKNQWMAKVRAIIRAQRSAQRILKGEVHDELGWDGDHGVQMPSGTHIAPGRRARLLTKPTFVNAKGWPAGTTLNSAKPPDARLRIQVLRDGRANLGVGAPVVPVLSTWNAANHDAVIASYAAVAQAHQGLLSQLSEPIRTLVYGNNVGVLSFTEPTPGEYSATHAILSASGDGTTGSDFTHHVLDLTRASAGPAPTLVAGG